MPPAAQSVIRLVVILSVPILILTASIYILAREPVLEFEYSRSSFPSAGRFTDEERLTYAVPATRFVVTSAQPEGLLALEHDGEPVFGQEEVNHLVDVQVLVRRLTWLSLAGLAVFLIALVAAWLGALEGLPRSIEIGGRLTAALVVLIGFLIVVAWPFFFVGFHRVFFRPGTWQFPVDSGLITLFPEQFWFDTAVAIAAMCFLGGLGAAGLGRLLDRRTRLSAEVQ
jgi:integral membrane protein (TIGR01906 family)